MGNSIGANKVPLSKRFTLLLGKITFVLALIISANLFYFKQRIIALFTSDTTVQELTHGVIKLMAVIFLFDATQCFLCGPIRALNLINQQLNLAFLALFVLGLPLSCLFAFLCDMGVFGLQLGMGLALSLQSMIYLRELCAADWEQLACEAVKRI